MKKQVFTLSNGRAKQDAIEYIMTIAGPDPLMVVTVDKHKKNRSLAQNSLYWKWIGEMRDFYLESTGEPLTAESIHDDLRRAFLKVKPTTDIVTQRPKLDTESTKTLNVAPFAEYLNKIHAHAATSWGLTLTIPPDLRYAMVEDMVVKTFNGEKV